MPARIPTAEQQAVIDHAGSHARLLAPPGTGKTDSIAGRVDRLMASDGVAADHILALSFSRLAAHELGERIEELRGPGSDYPRPRTLHAYALEQLRTNHLNSICGDLIIDDWEMRGFLRQDIADRIGGTTGAKAEALLHAMEADWRTLKDEDIPLPAERAALEDALRSLRPVFNFALLGELVYRFKRWAESQPDFRPRLKHMLVDEYQDLNNCEQTVIELLQSKSAAELIAAGDDDQSIYGWREANMVGIQQFPAKFSATPYSLTECWRCGQTIIDAAWAVVEQITGRPMDKTKPMSKRAFPGKVAVVAARSAQASPKDVAKLVKALVDADGEFTGPGDIMILVPRKNFASDYEREITALSIPVANLAQSELILDSQGVRKLLYSLRLALNPTDAIALRALMRLYGQIGPAKVKPLVDGVIAGRYPSLLTAARASDNARVQELLQEIDALPTIDPGEDALSAIDRMANADNLTEDEKSAFIELSQGIVGNDMLTISAFLPALTEYRVRPQPAPMKDSQGPVRLMTLRQAKGLSAPVVFVTDLDDEIVPGHFDQDRVDEQRRLLYVSMTRAERSLYLFWCGHRARHTSRWAGTGSQRRAQDQRTICRFLDGLGLPSYRIDQLT